jgi:hypothetical protein
MNNKVFLNVLTLILFIILAPLSFAKASNTYIDTVNKAGLTEVANTIQLNNEGLINSVAFTQRLQAQKSYLLLSKLSCLAPSALDGGEAPILTDCSALQPLVIEHPTVPVALSSMFNELLKEGILQGYNIKKEGDVTTRASGKTSLVYGHSSMAHAKQLIALLTLNDIHFTWQLIAKSSAFNIREGWDDAQSNESETKIRVAKEYDIRFNFADQANLEQFMPLINQYAKKDSDDEKGLIINAWWQPFYRSLYPQEAYQQVKRISLKSDGFVASTLVLNADIEKTIEQINTYIEHEKITVSNEDIWVNPAFFRYLNGGFQ